MKTIACILILILSCLPCAGESIRVKVTRERPAEREYYQLNKSGNIEKVREYKNYKVTESWEQKGATIIKRREVTRDSQNLRYKK
jgi:hypothetical protein